MQGCSPYHTVSPWRQARLPWESRLLGGGGDQAFGSPVEVIGGGRAVSGLSAGEGLRPG